MGYGVELDAALTAPAPTGSPSGPVAVLVKRLRRITISTRRLLRVAGRRAVRRERVPCAVGHRDGVVAIADREAPVSPMKSSTVCARLKLRP